MKRMKRMIAMVLAVCLLCGTLSMTVSASYIDDSIAADMAILDEVGYVSPFKDVPKNSWYYPYVSTLNFIETETGPILRGKTADRFAPSATVSRAEFAVMLHRAMMVCTSEAERNKLMVQDCKYEPVFKDVAKGQWYTDAVMWAYHNGVITGYTSGAKKGTFGLTDNITREQVATMIMRLVAAYWNDPKDWIGDFSQLSIFPDANKVSAFARDGMIFAYETELISGKQKNGVAYLDPLGKASRAEAAKMIYVFIVF